MHRLLEKQIRKATNSDTGALDLDALTHFISTTYADFDRMRAIEVRAMQLMSDELNEANAAIRRESEEMIKETQRRFEIAVNGTQDGIWDWNVQEDRLWFSRRALSMLGFIESDLDNVGIDAWLALVDSPDLLSARQFIENCMKGDARSTITLRFRERGGRVRHILCRAQSMQDSSGEVARVVGVHTDLSDLMAMQEELKKSRDKAEAANKAKSEFLANMTHELRTPLNSVITLSRLASETADEAERAKFLEIITGSSEILLGIVNDILDFSKIEANEMRLENITFDLVSAVGKSLVPVRHVAASKGLEFSISFDSDGAIPFFVGDPLRIGQVLTNLASNAVKYTHQGSISITVKVDVDEIDNSADIEFKVSDTGIGIPKDRQNSIFEKFTQVDSSTTRRYGGSGLGLAISNSIITLMGGRISLESEEGRGSVFTVRVCLPAVKALEKEPDPVSLVSAVKPAGETSVEDARVLVVEDHPMNQLVAEKVLRRFGFKHVTLAENGAVALRILDDEQYDLILMDCFMPEMDGYEATRAIRKREADTGRHIPIIAVTANASAEDRQRCIESGMDHYTVKPIVERDLLKLLGLYINFPIHVVARHAPAPATEKIALDVKVLQSYSAGDKATEQVLSNAFLEQSRINIEGLERAAAENDKQGWVRAAHTLKGGARSIGAFALGHLGAEAQEIKQFDKDACADLLARIKREFQTVEHELRRYVGSA